MHARLKPLNEALLRRLTNDALTTFLGEAVRYETAGRPGLQLVLSNEPIADMNMLVVGGGAEHAEGNAAVMASAYSMPRDVVLRVLPESFFATPGADVYGASALPEPGAFSLARRRQVIAFTRVSASRPFAPPASGYRAKPIKPSTRHG